MRKLMLKAFSWRNIVRPSLLRAVVLGALRFALAPMSWGGGIAFVAAATFLYFVPIFRPRVLLWPFLATVVLGLSLPPGVLSALALAILFALLFGIKDLEIVGRRTAYELFVFFSLFVASLGFFRAAPHWAAGVGFIGALAVSMLFFVLASLLPWQGWPREHRHSASPVFLGAAMMFELAMTLLFLPIDFISQGCILFMFGVFLALIVERVREGNVAGRFLVSAFGIFILATGFVLVLSTWKI
jgi:hypothetical protein